ncbi:MAG: S9 family peptidase [Planctomycetes bacterium]|nr:S9 family peptidase [Planctomycetota bacterium]
MPQPAQPPRPEKKHHELIGAGGHRRRDDYYWLKERENEQVLAQLEAENEWTNEQLKDTEVLQDKLFEEIKGRIKQDDCSVPYRLGNWYYYTRFEKGKQYPVHCRKAAPVEADCQAGVIAHADHLASAEVVVLDVNQLADGKDFCSVTGLEISPDSHHLAYCVDFQGRRFYSLCVKDLRSGKLQTDLVPQMSGNVVWANDNRTLFYVKQDVDTLRDHLVYRRDLLATGTGIADELIYDEKDEQFYCYLYRTSSNEYLILHSSQTICNEARYLKADDPYGEWQLFQERESGMEYSVDHVGFGFLVRTNLQAKNFRLVTATVGNTQREHWQEFVGHRDQVLLGEPAPFQDFIVLRERENAQSRLRVMRWDGSDDHVIEQKEDAYLIDFGANEVFASGILRFEYESMTTPDSTFDYDMALRTCQLVKQVEVLGNFDSKDYQSKRVWIDARDGAKVPISLVYRRDKRVLKNADKADDGYQPMPLVLYAYGAYGTNLDPYFSSVRLSLLDRGFVFAFAHVRGGQEMGRHWYEDGRLLQKQNTFNDFIDCGKQLIELGYTSAGRLYAQGGSAGGLVMGVIANQAPELWHGIVAQVPFVDIMTTMEDNTIPLTTFEYDEWGNPADEEFYRYMLAYSPYDNIKATDYPNLLITASLHDSQVQYWEPAKWIAKLRDHKTDNNLTLLKMEMNAGHGGVTGRFGQYREIALEYAFLIKLASEAQANGAA